MIGRRHVRPVSEWGMMVALMTAVGSAALYLILRFATRWGETDTSTFTILIRNIEHSGHLVNPTGNYPQGYGYQALVLMLHHLAGMNIAWWQLVGTILLVVWLVFPAWLLYRELTSSLSAAGLAVILLFMQPEFLFPLLRGTHEKFTRGLMLLAFFLLVRGARGWGTTRQWIGGLLTFYLVTFALITFNSFFASSVILGLMLSLLVAWIVLLRERGKGEAAMLAIRRLTFATVISLTFSFLFIFYVYQPATHEIRALHSIYNRLVALFLDVERKSYNPYAYVTTGWISLPVYFLVSAANWLLLAISPAIWLSWSFRWLQKRWAPRDVSQLLLWAFYGAFGFIGALSILADLTGSLGGNLQLRNFPTFIMFAAPLVASDWVSWQPRPLWGRRLATGLGVGLIALLSLLSVIKATNEPLLSNKWSFYAPSEMQSLFHVAEYLPGRPLWAGYDERLPAAWNIRESQRLPLRSWQWRPESRSLLISDVMRARSTRLSQPLPLHGDDLITYDNGQSQIYHRRPQTPFQR